MTNKPVMQYDQTTLTIGALAAGDLTSQVGRIDTARENGFRIFETMLTAAIVGKTATEGPMHFGMAINLGAAEIEAIMEQDPQDSTDPIPLNTASWIRPLWTISRAMTEGVLGGAGPAVGHSAQFLKVSVQWSVPEGQELVYWVYNQDTDAISIGGLITIFAQHYGVWLRD